MCPVRPRPPEQTKIKEEVTIRAGLLSGHCARSKSNLMRARLIALAATAPLLKVTAPKSAAIVPRAAAAYVAWCNAALQNAANKRSVIPTPLAENHGRERSRSMY